MKAKPDEIWTNSILHMAGLLVHADTRVRKKKHLIQQRHARGAFRVVNGHVNLWLRLGCLVDGCCCADLNVKAGNGVPSTGIAPDHEHRHWSGQLHLGMTLTVLWAARMVRRCGQVLVLWDYELAFPDTEACWRFFFNLFPE